MVGCYEAYRHLSVFVNPSSEILCVVDVSEFLRDVIVEDLRIVLFDDSFESRLWVIV